MKMLLQYKSELESLSLESYNFDSMLTLHTNKKNSPEQQT